MRIDGGPGDDRGSSPVEFVLVGTLLTALTLAVLQLGVAVYVRNVVHDAAVEGAYVAARADTTPAEGVQRSRDAISSAIGAGYAEDIAIARVDDGRSVEVRITTALPVIGLIGVPGAVTVSARAPEETFDER